MSIPSLKRQGTNGSNATLNFDVTTGTVFQATGGEFIRYYYATGSFGQVVGRAAVGSIITQGVGVATGLQKSFSWRSVAASAVSAGVGYGIGQVISAIQSGSAANAVGQAAAANPWGDALQRFATGVLAGAASSAVQGRRVNWNSVIQSAVGATIGEAVQADAKLEVAQAARFTEMWNEGLSQPNRGLGLRRGAGAFSVNNAALSPLPEVTAQTPQAGQSSGQMDLPVSTTPLSQAAQDDPQPIAYPRIEPGSQSNPRDWLQVADLGGTSSDAPSAAAGSIRRKVLKSAIATEKQDSPADARDAFASSEYREQLRRAMGAASQVAAPSGSINVASDRALEIPTPYGSGSTPSNRTWIDRIGDFAGDIAYRLQGLAPVVGSSVSSFRIAGPAGSAAWTWVSAVGAKANEIATDAIRYGPVFAYTFHSQAINTTGIAAVELGIGYDALAPSPLSVSGKLSGANSGRSVGAAEAIGLETRGLIPAPGTRQIPEGIPDTWRIRATQGEGGVLYYNPKNPNENIRVMQGNPNSPYANSQGPYVRQQNSAGTYLREDGSPSPLPRGGRYDPDAHIPLQRFKVR